MSTTCWQLFDGGQSKSVYWQAVNAVAAVESGDLTQTSQASAAADDLDPISKQAGPQLQPLVMQMRVTALQASMATAVSHQPDTARFSDAAKKVIDQCPDAVARAKAQYDSHASATPSPASSIKGSYQESLAALGVHADDWAYYTAYMKQEICESSGASLGLNVRMIMHGTPASGGGTDVVRLTIDFFCPEKRVEIATAVAKFGP